MQDRVLVWVDHARSVLLTAELDRAIGNSNEWDVEHDGVAGSLMWVTTIGAITLRHGNRLAEEQQDGDLWASWLLQFRNLATFALSLVLKCLLEYC